MLDTQNTFWSLNKWIDAILPTRCAACGDPSGVDIFCILCENAIEKNDPLSPDFDIPAAFLYQGTVKKIIRRAKFLPDENSARALIRYWKLKTTTDQLQMQINHETVDAVCFIPIHWRRRFRRGFDFSVIFAQAIAQRLTKPVLDLLICQRFDKPLSLSQSRSDREHAVHEKFAIKKVVHQQHILLVDDITTTGATLNAGEKELTRQGHRVTKVALAKAPLKNSRP